MRFLIHLFLMAGIALALGFGLSWYALSDGRLFGAIEIGPWQAWYNAGSPTPDPYARAYLARSGTLQLGQSEGLQFVAIADSAGERLTRNCSYRIEGRTPVATFWTLVPVGPDGTSVAQGGGPPAFNSTRLVWGERGAMALHLGKMLRSGNWLELAGDGPFSLVLTLYDTASFAGVGAQVATLPTITAEGCA